MLTVYGADLSCPANKVRFVANALGIEYEYKRVKLKDGEHRLPDFLKLNPVGKIPIVDDNGFVLFESDAIIKYLSSKNKSVFYSEDIKKKALIDQWLDFISIHINGAMNRIVFNRIFAPFLGAEVDEKSYECGVKFINRFLPVVENQIQKNKFFLGEDLSLVDFALLSTLDPVEAAGQELSTYPSMSKWRQCLKKESFYTKCHDDYKNKIEQMKAYLKK